MAANDGTPRITVFLHRSILVYISIIILLAWALTHDPSEKLLVSFQVKKCSLVLRYKLHCEFSCAK